MTCKFVVELNNPEIIKLGVDAIIDFYHAVAIDNYNVFGRMR